MTQETKTTKTKWESATGNLIKRRSTGVSDNAKCENIVADYHRHLRGIIQHGAGIGNSVLDVGCGDMSIGRILEQHYPNVKYMGVDAFPVNDQVTGLKIEDAHPNMFAIQYGEFDTIVCFAALDSMHDLVKACNNMKGIAKKSIIFLTGIDIEPDQYHTFKITEPLLHELMKGWKVSYSNYLTEKVLLIQYTPE